MSEIRAFLSYSHADVSWLDRIGVHVKPLEREGILELWSDKKIPKGKSWLDEIKSKISSANVAVFLVSADFLASDFAQDVEIPDLLNKLQNKGLKILILILKPCNFAESPLSKFQAMNGPNKTIIAMNEVEQEELFSELAREIRNFSNTRISESSAKIINIGDRKDANLSDIKEGLYGRIFNNRNIYVPDLFRIPSEKQTEIAAPITSGISFINCFLFGLCHVIGLGSNYNGCTFNSINNNIENNFRSISEMSGTEVFSMPAFSHCNFNSSEFYQIVFWMPQEIREHFLKQIR